ncbi:hypothetical protein LX36DRAFT_500111 [Colletotrichum falcatum]|nr:hypothetical protein LX36DRAFT_500111 [Colletotrichum falcatum]
MADILITTILFVIRGAYIVFVLYNHLFLPRHVDLNSPLLTGRLLLHTIVCTTDTYVQYDFGWVHNTLRVGCARACVRERETFSRCLGGHPWAEDFQEAPVAQRFPRYATIPTDTQALGWGR